MRVGNLAGRLVLLSPEGHALDVASLSDGRFDAAPQAVFERWDEFCAWARTADLGAGRPFSPSSLGAPVPSPRQVFAVGMNYAMHADEVGIAPPERPPVFTKFPSSITGPYAAVEHPGGDVDWEAELVVAIGRGGYRLAEESSWDHVAGLMAGLDLSERRLQHEGAEPQYSLGKSYPGFGPIGPWLVTPDELPDPNRLELGCLVNGETVQSESTANMLFPVGRLIALLSAVTPLLPGDLIFTGTPAGVGERAVPPRFLAVGDEVVGYVRGVGEVRTPIVARDGDGVAPPGPQPEAPARAL